MKLGEYRFLKIFDGTGAWGSALPFEGWRKPYRFMGPIELKKPKPPPPPPLLFDCVVTMETPKAWLVEIEHREHWLPKSQCTLSDDNKHIEIPNWLWREKRAA
jgi:hypothetical protein